MAAGLGVLPSMIVEVDGTATQRLPLVLEAVGAWLESDPSRVYTDIAAALRAAEEAAAVAAPTTAVQDRLVLDPDDEVKPYLGLLPTDMTFDWLLSILVPAALRAADDYLHNPFLDADGVELDIPDTVKTGVLRWIKVQFAITTTGSSSGTVLSERAGDLARTYGTRSTAMDPASLDAAVLMLWRPYRLPPGL